MDNQHIIAMIEAHAKRTGLAPATITGRAVDNTRLYDRLVNGGNITLDVANRLAAFIAADQPRAGAV